MKNHPSRLVAGALGAATIFAIPAAAQAKPLPQCHAVAHAPAVLNAVTTAQLGKASGINYMAQRFGAVFAIAIGTALFSAYGGLGDPVSVTAGFRPALWSGAVFAALAALAALAIPAPSRPAAAGHPVPGEESWPASGPESGRTIPV